MDKYLLVDLVISIIVNGMQVNDALAASKPTLMSTGYLSLQSGDRIHKNSIDISVEQ